MNRGRARQSVFRDPTDYETFLQVVRDAHALWGIEVLAYCLMGNHYHFLLQPPRRNKSSLSSPGYLLTTADMTILAQAFAYFPIQNSLNS